MHLASMRGNAKAMSWCKSKKGLVSLRLAEGPRTPDPHGEELLFREVTRRDGMPVHLVICTGLGIPFVTGLDVPLTPGGLRYAWRVQSMTEHGRTRLGCCMHGVRSHVIKAPLFSICLACQLGSLRPSRLHVEAAFWRLNVCCFGVSRELVMYPTVRRNWQP